MPRGGLGVGGVRCRRHLEGVLGTQGQWKMKEGVSSLVAREAS